MRNVSGGENGSPVNGTKYGICIMISGELKMKKNKIIELISGYLICGMSGYVMSQGFIYISAFKFVLGTLLLAAGIFFVVKGAYGEK